MVVALFKEVALPETFDLFADLSDWSSSVFCAGCERLMCARRFEMTFLDVRCESLIDYRGMRHETDTGSG